MKYIYDKETGKYIDYVQTEDIDVIKIQYPDMFVLDNFIGEIGIIENNRIREKTRIERVELNEEELMDGEYIENDEIKIKPKPSDYHNWDKSTEEWVHDSEKEISELKSYLKGLDKVLFEKEDLRNRAENQNRSGAAEAFQEEIDQLLADQAEKQARLDELESEE